MQRRWITVSITALVLAGCQSMGGIYNTPATPSTPSTPETGVTTPTPPPPPPPSAWDIARDNGMVFRAAGHDPGWSVEVQKSRAPTLFVVLDSSQRHLQVPHAMASSDPETGTIRFRGTANDGTPVELDIQRGQCKANMADKKASASAELNVGATQYHGCGRFLF